MDKTENKLLEFQKRITAIKKDGKNPHFKSSYATLHQILSEVKPILSELGLTLTQPISRGKVYTVIYEGEKQLNASSIKLPEGLSPQQLGSAITYFRRYTLASLLALEIEDDDANEPQNALKPFLNKDSAIFEQASKFLRDGGTMDAIEAKYTMSEEVKDKLRKSAGV